MGMTEQVLGTESRFLMSRVMPREFLDGVREYLQHRVPEREYELMKAIRTRADALAEADADTAVDNASTGALALGAVVLAAYETLRPLFDGDEQRTIALLQNAMSSVLKRPYQLLFSTLSERKHALDTIEKVCRKEEPFYGAGWDISYARPEPERFEMSVGRCFWHDFFARHDATLVTTVMCSWDVNWMQAIDPSASGLRAERTSLLSLGDDRCRFAVLETSDPKAGYSDKLEQQDPGQEG